MRHDSGSDWVPRDGNCKSRFEILRSHTDFWNAGNISAGDRINLGIVTLVLSPHCSSDDLTTPLI